LETIKIYVSFAYLVANNPIPAVPFLLSNYFGYSNGKWQQEQQKRQKKHEIRPDLFIFLLEPKHHTITTSSQPKSRKSDREQESEIKREAATHTTLK